MSVKDYNTLQTSENNVVGLHLSGAKDTCSGLKEFMKSSNRCNSSLASACKSDMQRAVLRKNSRFRTMGNSSSARCDCNYIKYKYPRLWLSGSSCSSGSRPLSDGLRKVALGIARSSGKSVVEMSLMLVVETMWVMRSSTESSWALSCGGALGSVMLGRDRSLNVPVAVVDLGGCHCKRKSHGQFLYRCNRRDQSSRLPARDTTVALYSKHAITNNNLTVVNNKLLISISLFVRTRLRIVQVREKTLHVHFMASYYQFNCSAVKKLRQNAR